LRYDGRSRDLKQNLRHFGYVLAKFGLTWRERGATGHGLRHEANQEAYAELTGEPPPVRGGALVPPDIDRAARLRVAALAGHGRAKASSAYLGQSVVMRSKRSKRTDPPAEQDDSHCA
jgi:hypothetical protein